MKTLTVCLTLASVAAVALGQNAPPEPKAPAPPPAARDAAKPVVKRKVSAAAMLPAVIKKVEYAATPFEQALDELAERVRINVTVRWNKLEAVGVQRDAPITVSLQMVTLGHVLREMMREAAGPDVLLAYKATDAALLISTAQDIGSAMMTKVYDVRDLLAVPIADAAFETGTTRAYVATLQPVVAAGAVAMAPVIQTIGSDVRLAIDAPAETGSDPNGQDPERKIRQLIDAITTTIEPDSWAVNGGKGTIVPRDGLLIVRNTVFVHNEISRSRLMP